MVINHTVQSVTDNLSKGVYPDMISYGLGLEINGLSELNVSKTTLGGKIGEKTYGAAWCRGGYVLISNPKLTEGIENLDTSVIDELIVSQGEYTEPLTAFLFSGYTAKSIEVLKPMDAYVKFTSGKVAYFLGTQRDVNRLNNRGMEYSAFPLDGYNDLYQYVSITGVDQVKRYYSEQFVEYLLSDDVQGKLKNIGMFSPYVKVDYDDETLQNMQNVESKNTLSVFTPPSLLKEMQTLSLSAAVGNKESLNKIKKIVL